MVKVTTDQKLTLIEFLELSAQDVDYEFVNRKSRPSKNH